MVYRKILNQPTGQLVKKRPVSGTSNYNAFGRVSVNAKDVIANGVGKRPASSTISSSMPSDYMARAPSI